MYGDDRVGRWCWETSVQSILLMWIIVGQGPIVFSIVRVGVFNFFSLSPTMSIFFLLCSSINYRDFSVKSKAIISLFHTVKSSLSQKIGFS